MVALPEADIYERSLRYWPYAQSLGQVLEHVVDMPEHGRLLDMMCGPGYLLGRAQSLRPDLKLTGVDLDERYVEYGRATYPGVEFMHGDVRNWAHVDGPYDRVVCTGALHHVPLGGLREAIQNLAALTKRDGVAVITDCYLPDYKSEPERRKAALQLGNEYTLWAINKAAPADVLGWTLDITRNDVLADGEWKTSLSRRLPILEEFLKVSTVRVWPGQDSDWGDMIHYCTPK